MNRTITVTYSQNGRVISPLEAVEIVRGTIRGIPMHDLVFRPEFDVGRMFVDFRTAHGHVAYSVMLPSPDFSWEVEG